MAGAVELGLPGGSVARATRALRASAAVLALALATDRVQRRVRASDQMEVITDDPRVRQLGADRFAVGIVGVDRDHLDHASILLGQRAQVALNAAAAAPVEHLDHAATIEIGDHGRELAAAPVMRLIQRQPPRRSNRARRLQRVTAIAERARDLLVCSSARGLLLARDLGVRGASLARVPAAAGGSAQSRAVAPATRDGSR